MFHTRWTLLEMRKDALQRGLPAPDEACAKHHCLHQGVEAPDLATIKDFFRFYIATSCGRIVAKPTVDSINTNAEWFFAGFSRITGTEINEEDRTEVYKVSASSYKRGGLSAEPKGKAGNRLLYDEGR
jgi:hypothetical protein